LDDHNNNVSVNTGETIHFKILYRLDNAASSMTFVIDSYSKGAENRSIIDMKTISDESKRIKEAAGDEMSNQVSDMANAIIKHIDNDDFEAMIPYGQYVIISAIDNEQTPALYEGFEEGYWLEAATYPDPFSWGYTSNGNEISMTINDMFNQYFTEPGYSGVQPEIIHLKDETEKEYSWLDSGFANYCAKFTTSDNRQLYMVFEEVAPNELSLIAMRFSVE
jgi:hypothetical protein